MYVRLTVIPVVRIATFSVGDQISELIESLASERISDRVLPAAFGDPIGGRDLVDCARFRWSCCRCFVELSLVSALVIVPFAGVKWSVRIVQCVVERRYCETGGQMKNGHDEIRFGSAEVDLAVVARVCVGAIDCEHTNREVLQWV